jgi:uncharacterized protein
LETLLRGGAFLNSRHPLRLNVGFLLHKNVGYSRNFDFDLDTVRVGEDLEMRGLKGSLLLTRTSQGVFAHGSLQAQHMLECVRCLGSYHHHSHIDLDDLFSLANEAGDDPSLIIPESGLLDLNPVLREHFWLDIPIQPLCRPDCKGLCAQCGINLNEGSCDHPLDNIDPRLEPLSALLHDSAP